MWILYTIMHVAKISITTSSSAVAEGPRYALDSRNSATTNHPGPIVWHYMYLRDPTFSRFHAVPECDRHTQTDR